MSADGSQVAVTGSVKGQLDSSDGKVDAKTTDTVVTVFDNTGQELWSQRAGAATADDTPASVAFGANGEVYVAGQTSGALFGGGGSKGSTDSFIQTFSATKKPLYDGAGSFAYTPKLASTTQFGTSGVDRNAGMAVSGSNLYLAGVEDGHAVVRLYDISSGKPVLTTTRDLGELQGGDVAGLAVQPDGTVVVAGSTHNGALDAGTVTQAYGGTKKAAFVASLSGDLQSAPSDTLTYVGGDADQTASAVTVSGGKVYLTGTIATGAKTVGKGRGPNQRRFRHRTRPHQRPDPVEPPVRRTQRGGRPRGDRGQHPGLLGAGQARPAERPGGFQELGPDRGLDLRPRRRPVLCALWPGRGGQAGNPRRQRHLRHIGDQDRPRAWLPGGREDPDRLGIDTAADQAAERPSPGRDPGRAARPRRPGPRSACPRR